MEIRVNEIMLRKLYLQLKAQIGYPPARRVMHLLRKTEFANKDEIMKALREINLDDKEIETALQVMKKIGIIA